MQKKKIKDKKCRTCRHEFTPFNTLQVCCSGKCALQYSVMKREKKERKELRERKKKLKSKSQHLRDCQIVFNRFIRIRDKGKKCICCQRDHVGQWHASHFRSTGSCPELRFCEDNVHSSCAPCNTYLSGNLVHYRINLIKRIGLEKVEWLEGTHETPKLSMPDIIEIKQKYKLKCREMERENEWANKSRIGE